MCPDASSSRALVTAGSSGIAIRYSWPLVRAVADEIVRVPHVRLVNDVTHEQRPDEADAGDDHQRRQRDHEVGRVRAHERPEAAEWQKRHSPEGQRWLMYAALALIPVAIFVVMFLVARR